MAYDTALNQKSLNCKVHSHRKRAVSREEFNKEAGETNPLSHLNSSIEEVTSDSNTNSHAQCNLNFLHGVNTKLDLWKDAVMSLKEMKHSK